MATFVLGFFAGFVSLVILSNMIVRKFLRDHGIDLDDKLDR